MPLPTFSRRARGHRDRRGRPRASWPSRTRSRARSTSRSTRWPSTSTCMIQREVVISVQLNLLARPGATLGRHRAGRVVPPRHRPVPGVPRPASCPDVADRGRQLHRRRGPAARRERRRLDRPPSARRWRPRSTASTCWPRTSRTTPRTRPGSSPSAATRIPAPDRARQDDARGLPARRPAGQPAGDPAGVRGPRHQPDQAGVAARRSGASATTASSSTSRATWPTSWWPTVSATSSPSTAR